MSPKIPPIAKAATMLVVNPIIVLQDNVVIKISVQLPK